MNLRDVVSNIPGIMMCDVALLVLRELKFDLGRVIGSMRFGVLLQQFTSGDLSVIYTGIIRPFTLSYSFFQIRFHREW